MTPPFDFPVAGASASATGTTRKEHDVPELKRYNAKVGKYDTVLQLSDEDAKNMGLSEKDLVDAPAKKAPAKKAAGPAGPKKAPAKKAATPANKSRSADDNKGA